MDRTFIRRLARTACGAALCTLVAPAQDAADYWPMVQGSTWTQEVTANGQTVPIQMTVTRNSRAGGQGSEAAVEYRAQGQVTQIEIYRSDASGLYRVASGKDGTAAIEPALPVIHYPLVPGSTWSWKGSIAMGTATFAGKADLSASAAEKVITPAGTFQAVRVHLDLLMGDAKSGQLLVTNDYWFAPGVGLIQQTANFAGTVISGVLTSYRLQK